MQLAKSAVTADLESAWRTILCNDEPQDVNDVLEEACRLFREASELRPDEINNGVSVQLEVLDARTHLADEAINLAHAASIDAQAGLGEILRILNATEAAEGERRERSARREVKQTSKIAVTGLMPATDAGKEIIGGIQREPPITAAHGAGKPAVPFGYRLFPHQRPTEELKDAHAKLQSLRP